MTQYRLWPSTSGPGSPDPDDDTVNLGVEFEVSEPVWLTEYHFWVATGQATGARSFGLFEVNSATSGTLVTGSTVTSGTLTEGQWNTVPLDAPIQLQTGTRYRAVVLTSGTNNYSATGSYWSSGAGSSGITNGPLTAVSAASATGGDQGSFVYNASLTYPNDSFSAANYWVDITVEDVLLVQSASSDSANPSFGSAPTSGNLLVAVGGDRSGQDTSGTITDWTQADTINHKPADTNYRMSATVWVKESDGTETGAIAFPANVDYRWIGEIATSVPFELADLLVDSGALDFVDNSNTNVSAVTTPTLSPSSDDYVKIGVCVIKEDGSHGPVSFDENLTTEDDINFAGTAAMHIAVGLHADTESTTQDLTATLTTATARGAMAFYLMIGTTAASGDQDLNVPHFANVNQVFAPTIENQASQNLSVSFIPSGAQVFAATIENQVNLDLNVNFKDTSAVVFQATANNEGDQLFEPILAGNGSLADQIFNGLISQGFLFGSMADRERERLLAKLALSPAVNFSIQDLYDLANEDNRIAGLEEPVFA